MSAHAAPDQPVTENPTNRGPAAKELNDLQLDQYQHDRKYHTDICLLSVHQRLNHMALHFAKYAGRFARCVEEPDPSEIDRTLVDTFIIGLVSANSTNMRLSDRIPESWDRSVPNIRELGHLLARSNSINSCDPSWLLQNISLPTGRMAKACESVDHLEAYPFREEICEAVVTICRIAMIAAARRGLDLSAGINERRSPIKERHIFHGYL